MTTAPAELPRRAIRLLWLTGIGLDVFAIMGLLADADPQRMGSRILGAIILAAIGAVAMVAAIMARSRPLLARRLGLVASAGMLFVAWLVLSRPWTSPFTVVIGRVLLTVGASVAWQLYRWRGTPSGEPEDGANLA